MSPRSFLNKLSISPETYARRFFEAHKTKIGKWRAVLDDLRRLHITRLRIVAAATAIFGVVLFYLPLVGALQPTSSGWPGFMMSGDIQKFYLPAFVEGYRRFWNGGMFGLDFLTLDGASVFAFRANLSPFYPPFLVSYLFFDMADLSKAAVAYCVIHILHTATALYCCVMLGRRFIGLTTAASITFGLLYCLSYQAAAYIAFATFFFQMMLVPVVAYTLCCLMTTRSPVAVIFASPIFLCMLLSSYGPMMAAAFLTAIIVAAYVFLFEINRVVPSPIRCLIAPAASVAVSCAVALPYYIAQLKYAGEVAPSYRSVQAIAQELSFSGGDLINGFSQALQLGYSATEGRLIWGLIPATLLLLALIGIARWRDKLPASLVRLFAFSACFYLMFLFITLGRTLATAEMFYYSVPVLGTMHLFQRYLLFGQLFFALAVASGTQLFLSCASTSLKTGVLVAAIFIWITLSLAIKTHPGWASGVDIDSFLTELFVAFIALAAVAILRPTQAMIAVGILSAIISVQTMYSMQSNLGRPNIWKSELNPLSATQRDLVAFLKTNSTKAISKVLYLTKGPGTFLYRNYPWLIGNDVKIMSYHGYETHLSMIRGYWALMGGSYDDFNRDWVARTGVDYLVWDNSTNPIISNLQQLLGKGFQLGPTFSQGPELTFGKIINDKPLSIGEFGDPVIDLQKANQKDWPSVVISDGWEIEAGTIKKIPGKISNFNILANTSPDAPFELSFDATGTKGLITTALGSFGGTPITITGPGRYQIKLTPLARSALWIGATEDFNGALSNITLREVSPNAEKPLPVVADNGLLRIEAQPDGTIVHSMTTDYAKSVKADVTVGSNARLVYLLFPIDYMVPYLDGLRVEWKKSGNWPAYLNLSAGRHQFELRFESIFATAFVVAVYAYLTTLLICGLFAFASVNRRLPDRLLKT